MAEEISKILDYFYSHYYFNRRLVQKQVSERASSVDPSTKTVDLNIKEGSEKLSFSDILSQSMGSTQKTLSAIFKEASRKYNVPEELLVALGYEESRFRSNAVSSAGAVGIMQLMPATAKALGVMNAYDPEQNIMGGAKYLGQMLTKYNRNIDLALAAYGAGSGAVDRAGGIPENMKNYIAKVHKFMEQGIIAPDTPVKTSGL